MTKSFGAKGLTGNAKAWNDAAPAMSRQNAKSPMVIEQSPNGMIMGRATTAKPSPNRNMGKTLTGNFKPLTTKEKSQRDAGNWSGAAPRMANQNSMVGPMVYTQDAKSGKISGEKVGYRSFDRNLQRTGSGTSKAQGAYINEEVAPMGKGMTKGDGHKVDKKLIMFNTKKGMMHKGDMCKCGSGMSKSMCKCGGMSKAMTPMGKGQGAYINDGTVPVVKGMMCKCGSGMSKAKCDCGMGKTMSKAAKSGKSMQSVDNASRTKMSPADMAEQARWDGLTKKSQASMRKAMPVAKPNPMNSRPITDPGMPSKSLPISPPRNPGPMKPMPSKPAPGKLSRPMPMPTPGKSGQYGGINPAGMYTGGMGKRSK
jgi:hypothetical protein